MAGPTHPVAVIAKLLDLTPRRVFQLTNEGVIPRAERGRYELVPAVRGYIRYLKDRAIGADALPDEAARASRARLVRAQAEAQEMENSRNRGEMLPRETVRSAWADMVVSFRARTLSIPKKAAPQVFGINSLPEIESILERMIVEALDELSHADYSGSGQGDSGPEAGDGVAGEAPSEADGEPVGGPEPEAVPREQRGAGAVDHL
jgi:phage terminase Nu1 subunit (DNA packaging protein)